MYQNNNEVKVSLPNTATKDIKQIHFINKSKACKSLILKSMLDEITNIEIIITERILRKDKNENNGVL